MDIKKNTVHLYMKYVVRKPIMFLTFVFICVTLFVNITLNTKIPVSKRYTCDTSFSSNDVLEIQLHKNLNNVDFDTVYIYENRNQYVYSFTDFEHSDGKITIRDHDEFPESLRDKNGLFVEVKQDEMNLFELIFVKGGKNGS